MTDQERQRAIFLARCLADRPANAKDIATDLLALLGVRHGCIMTVVDAVLNGEGLRIVLSGVPSDLPTPGWAHLHFPPRPDGTQAEPKLVEVIGVERHAVTHWSNGQPVGVAVYANRFELTPADAIGAMLVIEGSNG